MQTPDHRRWSSLDHPFTTSVPLRLSVLEDRPTAPLVVFCHGMAETPERFLEHWPRVCAMGAHLLAPAGPFPMEVRTANPLRIGHAWYLYDGTDGIFEKTVRTAQTWLREVVSVVERTHGLNPAARVLIGHSQGAYFGYVAALTQPPLFHALVAVAGRLKQSFTAGALSRPGALQTLILHGEKDRAVPTDAAERSFGALRDAGYAAELRLLPGGHGLPPDRDEAAAAWLSGFFDSAVPTTG